MSFPQKLTITVLKILVFMNLRMRNIGLSAIVASVLVLASCSSESGNVSVSKSVKDVVFENILSRRSIRNYKDTPIDSAALRDILWCGINAPNGQGRESWEVRVINDRKFLAEIDSLYGKYVSEELKMEKAGHHASYGAPTLILIAYDMDYDVSQVDCGLLGGNIILAANSMGIGSCCLGGLCRFINSESGAEILEKLDFPSTHRLLYGIALGYPNESPSAKPRNWDRVMYI